MAIIWINADLFFIGPFETSFNEIQIRISIYFPDI